MTNDEELSADQGSTVLADASPEKRFFISMLVRDIETVPAIMDLVDNSVEGAQRQLADASNGYVPSIQLTVGHDRFEIADNCGGIPLDIAREYAFRFGRPPGFPATPGGVGQFGVGMKRALFKLGDHFTLLTRAEHDAFEMDVDVDEWAEEPGNDWTFELQNVRTDLDAPPAADRQTVIAVTQLHPSVAEDITHGDVVDTLRRDLQLRHQVALEIGIEIQLNQDALSPVRPSLRGSNEITPIHVDTQLESGVRMRLYAGLSGDLDDEREDDDAEQFRAAELAGWYLFCNNRLLLAADKSPLTGWGTTVAAYHPQYRRFRGYVFLDAEDSSQLPWNTTKTGVDRDSPVFREARDQMDRAMKRVVSVVNRVKTERQTQGRGGPLQTAFRRAAEQTLGELPESNAFVVPPTETASDMPSMKRIAYDVLEQEFDRVRSELGVNSAADVGRATFAYYLETQVSESR
jgi:hypothetical protein